MRGLVIGGSGLVGWNVLQTFDKQGYEATGTYLTSSGATDIRLDKTDAQEVKDVVSEVEPDVIVDTAAFHAVDECEEQRDRAWTVNATGTRNIAVAANEVDAHFIYLSTDYVFSGNPDAAPYRESDPVNPINYYAEAKYGGERAAKIADQVTILRPSVIYGLANANFVTWALGELREGNDIGIVDDQVARPTYAPDLASACLEIACKGVTGLYHATGPESLSRYEFTIQLADVFGHDIDLISPISSEELGQIAARPTDSSLDSGKLYELIETEFRSPTVAFEELLIRN